jgi:hypothetical protein
MSLTATTTDQAQDKMAAALSQPAPADTSAPSSPQGAPTPNAGAGPTAPANGAPTAPAAPTADPNHPSSIFHKVLETIGGGPKVKYTMGEDGKMNRTAVPTSNGDLAKTILAGALTGLFASAGKKGPGAALAAFGAGGQASEEKMAQADAQKKGQAQQDFQNNQQEQLKKAQVAEANSRTIMNNMQAEKLQGEALDEYVGSQQPLLASMASLADGEHLSQADVMSGLQKGTYHTATDLFIADGKTAKIGPDGKPVLTKNGTPEMEVTYTHVNNGPVAMTQDLYDQAANAGIAKFTKGTKVADNQQIPASQMMNIQQQITSVNLAQHEVQAVRTGLGVKGALDWDAVKSTPGMSMALMKFQGYMHAAGDDPMKAIQAMAAEKQDPKTGRMVANPDAKFAGLVTQAFGGGEVLKKYSDKLAADSEYQKEFGKTQGGLPAAITKDVEVQRRQMALLDAKERYKAQQADATAQFNIQPGDSPQQILSKIPPTWAQDIKMLVDYRANPKTFTTNPRKGDGLSRDKAYAIANMIDPTWDDTQYKSRADMRVDYTTGATSRNVRAIGTAVHHMTALMESQDRLYSSGFSTINAGKNALTPSFLKGDQTKVQEDINAVTHEVSNVFAGKGANIPEFEAWEKSIKPSASHAEFKAWVEEGVKLMSGRASQIAGDWQKGMGKPYDFSILTPSALADLKKLPGGDELANSVGITKGGAGGGFDHTAFPKAN